jgi:hypothetical protein
MEFKRIEHVAIRQVKSAWPNKLPAGRIRPETAWNEALAIVCYSVSSC